jgi:hypothetical protein
MIVSCTGGDEQGNKKKKHTEWIVTEEPPGRTNRTKNRTARNVSEEPPGRINRTKNQDRMECF